MLSRHPNGQWETGAHNPRLLWPDTLSLATKVYLYVSSSFVDNVQYDNRDNLEQFIVKKVSK